MIVPIDFIFLTVALGALVSFVIGTWISGWRARRAEDRDYEKAMRNYRDRDRP